MARKINNRTQMIADYQDLTGCPPIYY